MNAAPSSWGAGGDPVSKGLRGAPLLLGALVLALVWTTGRSANPGPIGFRLDDAWIHMVYARSLVREGGFHYNTGEPETGMCSDVAPWH